MKIIKIPARYLKIAPQKSTIPIRGRGGRFKGRVVVKNGDQTRSQYLISDYDANHDGRIESNEHGGVIRGRKNIKVKASNTSRGYVRKI